MSGLTNVPEHGAATGGATAKVEIYTTRACGYCVRAKRLLEGKGVAYIEHEIDGRDETRRHMKERADGRRTLPQIFINDRGIGGFMELYQLEQSGKLDALLRGAG